LYPQINGDFIGEFTPLSIGQHRIDILYSNQPISGSPYFANVFDPNSIELINLPKELVVGAENVFEGLS
jgi:filamin